MMRACLQGFDALDVWIMEMSAVHPFANLDQISSFWFDWLTRQFLVASSLLRSGKLVLSAGPAVCRCRRPETLGDSCRTTCVGWGRDWSRTHACLRSQRLAAKIDIGTGEAGSHSWNQNAVPAPVQCGRNVQSCLWAG